MKYTYKGIDKTTQQVATGQLEAISKQDAIKQASEQGIEVFSVALQTNSKKSGRKVKTTDLVLPIRELATLTDAGVALIDAINALAENDEHPNLAPAFSKIAQNIEGGTNFSDAIKQSDLPFPDYVSYLVESGELGGQLVLALNKAASQMEYDQAIRNDVKSALTYPAVLVGSGILAVMIIFLAVVPKFSYLLNSERELPFLAYAVLSMGKWVNKSPLILSAILLSVVVSIAMLFRQKSIQHKAINAALKLPVIGPWLTEQDTAKWASLASAMLTAKVSLVSALALAAKTSVFDSRRVRASAMVKDIEAGMSFSEALKKANLLPATSLNLITVGDKTGRLSAMLAAVADLHDKSCKRKMKQVLGLMEPIAILIVGSIIGVMIIGIVLAITSSTDIAI